MTADYPTGPESKAELVRLIAERLVSLQDLVASVAPGELGRPLDAEGWSVKDHLAHIVAWERRALAALHGRRAFEVMGVTEAQWLDSSIDRLNALLFDMDKDRSIEEVRNAWRDVHASVMAVVEALTDDELAREAVDARDGGTLGQVVAANTWQHYEEHEGWLREKLPVV